MGGIAALVYRRLAVGSGFICLITAAASAGPFALLIANTTLPALYESGSLGVYWLVKSSGNTPLRPNKILHERRVDTARRS